MSICIRRLGFSLPDDGTEMPVRGFMGTSLRPRELTYCNCVNIGPIDGLDPEDLTSAEVQLRARMLQVARGFRQHLAGCENCYVAGASPVVGTRRSRAIHCDYEITEADCVEGARFDDAIGCFSFIDTIGGIHRSWVQGGGYYQIPYRALLASGVDNLLAAGRLITMERVAHTSTRNTACCLVCGQAAGTAAATAAREDRTPRELDVEALQGRLVADGTLLEGVIEA